MIMMLGFATNPLAQIAGGKRHSFRLTCGLFVRVLENLSAITMGSAALLPRRYKPFQILHYKEHRSL